MLSSKVTVGFLIVVVLPLTSCSGEAIQEAFSADPQASQWRTSPILPTNFPSDLQYANASLKAVQQGGQIVAAKSNSQPSSQQTRWATPDSSQIVQRYYSNLLQKDDWKLTGRKLSQQKLVLLAKRDRLHVRVTIPVSGTLVPGKTGSGGTGRQVAMTVFWVDYSQSNITPIAKTTTPQSFPQPGDSDFIGPVNREQRVLKSEANSSEASGPIPANLSPYVKDLQQLGVLEIKDPNQPIERGMFARWLVEINNRLYKDRPTQQIRLTATNQKPVFKDVPSSNPNFPYIQGLAEAGFISSSLSGDAEKTVFQPAQPLTREVLLSWKVPIDFRKILPSTSTAKVQEVWGFKDTKQISAPALSAILADHTNGELANIRRLLGAALLFQPQKNVTQAEAAATLWFIGIAGEGYSAKDVLKADLQVGAS